MKSKMLFLYNINMNLPKFQALVRNFLERFEDILRFADFCGFRASGSIANINIFLAFFLFRMFRFYISASVIGYLKS